MPGKQHVRGVSDKEQRQYEHIVEEAKEEGRYKGREEEVAARTVLRREKVYVGSASSRVGRPGHRFAVGHLRVDSRGPDG